MKEIDNFATAEEEVSENLRVSHIQRSNLLSMTVHSTPWASSAGIEGANRKVH
jgi:hypothetical protein